MSRAAAYRAFLEAKVAAAPEQGLARVDRSQLHPALFDFQKDAVLWALRGGRRALFEAFGMGKTRQQLERDRPVCIHRRRPRGRRTAVIALDVLFPAGLR